MSNNLFIIGAIVSVVYFLMKFIEMRFISHEPAKPFKIMIQDTLVVYISAVVGMFVLSQFNVVDTLGGDPVASIKSAGASAVAFTDNPGF
jgi:hypothetical protein